MCSDCVLCREVTLPQLPLFLISNSIFPIFFSFFSYFLFCVLSSREWRFLFPVCSSCVLCGEVTLPRLPLLEGREVGLPAGGSDVPPAICRPPAQPAHMHHVHQSTTLHMHQKHACTISSLKMQRYRLNFFLCSNSVAILSPTLYLADLNNDLNWATVIHHSLCHIL